MQVKVLNRIKTVFILGRYPNPRLKRRINNEKKLGKVALICWDKVSSQRLFYEDPEVDVYPVKLKANGTNPIKRLLPTFIFIVKAKKILKKLSPEIMHVENVDMLVVAVLHSLFRKKKPKIIYEIADLHRLIIDPPKSFIDKIMKKIIIMIEKILCQKIDILIITSDKYYDVYYIKFVDKDKVVFIPNLPDLNAFKNYKKKNNGEFTIGFIGGIRYKEQMKLLVDAAKHKAHVFFAGFAFDNEIQEYCAREENVTIYGKYNYDKEISDIYGKVDCVYSVYNADLNNVKIALPNKLYESIYCELPIIVAKNTYLSEIVEEMGVGVSINHRNKAELENIIKKLSNDKQYYNQLVNACRAHKKKIDISIYNEMLLSKIKSLFR